MNQPLPAVYLVRHGQTTWAAEGRHTGLTDIPLTPVGEQEARAIGPRLAHVTFTAAFTSPLSRARRTAELSGFGQQARLEPDLVEWNYGEYEGLHTAEIRQQNPDWQLFRDGCPGGESVAQVGARADRVLALLRPMQGNTLVFSSGHFSRVLAARWLGLDASAGRLLVLHTASLSVLSYEHCLQEPVIQLWNQCP